MKSGLQWQDKPIPHQIHEEWKKTNRYSNGIAIIPGRVWRGPNKDKYLVFIDLDNQKAIDEVCRVLRAKNLHELSERVLGGTTSRQPFKGTHLLLLCRCL